MADQLVNDNNKTRQSIDPLMESIRLLCAQCNREFPTKSHLAAHLMYSHRQAGVADVVFACLHCDRICSRADNLDKHLWLHQPPTFKCSKCPTTFKRPDYLTSHLHRIHGIKGSARTDCSECGRGFKSQVGLARHLIGHQLPNGYVCGVCKRTFNSWQARRSHIRAHKNGSEIKGWPNQFPNHHTQTQSSDLRSQLGGNQLASRYVCARCSQTFPTRSHITVHFQQSHDLHKNLNKLIFYHCHLCRKAVFGLTKFNRHLLSHSEKTFACPECPLMFKRSDKLTDHLHKYHKEVENRPHVCAECGRIFTTRSGLTTHSTFHKPKQICCDICGVKFFQLGHLRVHLKLVHTSGSKKVTNEKFKCEVCGKQLESYRQMITHRTEHRRRQFKCPYCCVVSTGQKRLQNHIQKIHSNFVGSG